MQARSTPPGDLHRHGRGRPLATHPAGGHEEGEAVRPGPGSAQGHVRHRRSRCRGGGEADPGPGGRAVRRPGREGGGGVLTAGDRPGVRRRPGHGGPRLPRHRRPPQRNPGRDPGPARETLGGAPTVAGEPPGRAGDAPAATAREASTGGCSRRRSRGGGAPRGGGAGGAEPAARRGTGGGHGGGAEKAATARPRPTTTAARKAPGEPGLPGSPGAFERPCRMRLDQPCQTSSTERADVAPISAATSASTAGGTVSSTVRTARASPPPRHARPACRRC